MRAWCVAGARRFLTKGRKAPSPVAEATDRYRSEEDLPRRFVDECLTFVPDGWVESASIVDELESWAHGLGLEPPGMRDIAAILREHGCTDRLRHIGSHRRRTWTDVGLKAEAEPQ